MQQHALVTAGSTTKKDIWLTTYLHGLSSLAPAEAEGQAEEAVQRYEKRWSSDVLRRLQADAADPDPVI